MRIAIVTETFLPSVDGVVTRLTHAVERMTSLGHEVLVIAPDLGVTEHAGARVVGMRCVTLPFYRHRPFALPTRRVDAVLRQFRPDVVHAAQPMMLASSAARSAHRRGVPLVASYHTHIPRYLDLYRAWAWARPLVWWWIRRNHALADLNLVTSSAMREELAAHGVERLRVLRRGVDTAARSPRFRSSAMRARLSGGRVGGLTGAAGPAVLLYVGRLAVEKSIDTLRPLLDRRDDVVLAIVGDGPDRARLEEVFAGTATVFTGFLRGDELAAAFASADAFVFPSVTETLGLVILEAMASGLPVVAARSGPTVEQVEDGVTGRIHDAGDLDGLDRAVDEVVKGSRAGRSALVDPGSGDGPVDPGAVNAPVDPGAGDTQVGRGSGSAKVDLDARNLQADSDDGSVQVDPDAGSTRADADAGSTQVDPDNGSVQVEADAGSTRSDRESRFAQADPGDGRSVSAHRGTTSGMRPEELLSSVPGAGVHGRPIAGTTSSGCDGAAQEIPGTNRTAMGEAARSEALRYSWDAAGDDLLDCYRAAIEVHRVRTAGAQEQGEHSA